jgi:phosphodiesterase/alkaline phosphatase D-like protein
MKNFASFRVVTLALVAGYMLKTTSADADVTFFGVAAGDATTNDVIVWTRAKDEANPQPTAINAQISQDPTFITGVTTFPAGTAGSPTDFTVKSDLGGLELGTVYYYRFQTTNASVTSNVGKFKTAP